MKKKILTLAVAIVVLGVSLIGIGSHKNADVQPPISGTTFIVADVQPPISGTSNTSLS